jgi:N-acetylglucosamine-6-sulfatase
MSLHFSVSADLPNILILLTDDQDVVLGSFDHMPHVQSLLQAEGLTFENAFVHTPICCPSRSQILTGLYTHHGVARNNSMSGNCYGDDWKQNIENEDTYAIHAKKAGYTTAYCGKYLNRYGESEDKEIPKGWDHWLGLVGNSVYYNYNLVEGGVDKETKVHHHGNEYSKDYLPDILANKTLRWLDELKEPWLVVVAWPSPHGPFTPAPWAKDTMKNKRAPITANYNASEVYQQQKHWLIRQLKPISTKTAVEVDGYYQRRLETLKSVDDHVSKMVAKLEACDQIDNTVILYTSDNGFQFGQHRLAMDKRHLYENDIRVPFVVRGPGIPKNSTSTQLVANIDIAPTILDIAGLERSGAKDRMDGASFWNHAREKPDESFDKRHDLLITYHGEGNRQCGLSECPPNFDGVWWMPDSFNSEY